MNYINCKNLIEADEMRNALIFWSENTYQHIRSLQNAARSENIVLKKEFDTELNRLYEFFYHFNARYSAQSNVSLPSKPAIFFKENQRLINLLERIKFENLNGFPTILQNSVFHYIYEQRYISAIFGINSASGNVLITTKFSQFLNQAFICIYNQIYFWSIIGGIHQSVLLSNKDFEAALASKARNDIGEMRRQYNMINLELSTLSRPLTKGSLREVFENFSELNTIFLRFIHLIKMKSPLIFSDPIRTQLSESFYGTLNHIEAEHKYVDGLNKSISEKLF